MFNEGETGKRLEGRFQIQTSGRASRGVRRTRAVDQDRSLVCFVFPCPVSPPPDSLPSLQGLCSPPLDSVVVELSPRCSTLPWPKLHGQSDPFSQDLSSITSSWKPSLHWGRCLSSVPPEFQLPELLYGSTFVHPYPSLIQCVARGAQ